MEEEKFTLAQGFGQGNCPLDWDEAEHHGQDMW